jgi:TRAP-type mannitol/chloroaromatic compound transport system substrate-binding protein
MAIYPPFHEFADKVYKMSGGRLKIETFTAGAVVGTFDKFDAAVAGTISGFHSFSPYWTGKNPAFSFLSPVHGYPEAWMLEAWYMERGGLELARELYAQHNLFFVGPIIYGSDSMHFTKKWDGIEDFKGLKIRTPPGKATDMLRALGAAVVTLPPGEIYHALALGTIDAADFLSLSTMYGLGIHEVAPYFMTRGLVEPSGTSNLVVRMDLWEALPDDLKAIVETAVAEWSRKHWHLGEIADVTARDAMLTAGLTEVFVTDEDRDKVREVAMKVWKDWGARNPMAGRIMESHLEFMRFLKIIE